MDKNIAALLREDCRTVGVRYLDESAEGNELANAARRGNAQFPVSAKVYTYVTHLPLQVNQLVIVPVHGGSVIKLARVASIDDGVTIEPNASITYAWVIDVVDEAGHRENLERNQAIEATVAEAYKANLRKSFAETVLVTLAVDKADALRKLTAPKGA